MARGRRRDEWDRFSLLIATVTNLLQFGSKPQFVEPLELFPKALVDAADRAAIARAKQKNKVTVTVSDMLLMHGVVPQPPERS